MIDNLSRQKERLDDLIRNYQQPIITAGQSKDMLEMRILNENEEVDNLYVSTKTLFINDTMMIIKGVDGSLEKWEVKKIYPVDKKDEKINQLEEEIKKLKEMISNEPTKSNEPIRERNKSNANVDEYVEPKPKTNGKPISK
jgi:hypothetical protein